VPGRSQSPWTSGAADSVAHGTTAAWRAAAEQGAAGRDADVGSGARLSAAPLVHGDWLRPGTHLDLVGGFTPAMREADDEAVRRSRVFVDTPAALEEAGDVVQP